MRIGLALAPGLSQSPGASSNTEGALVRGAPTKQLTAVRLWNLRAHVSDVARQLARSLSGSGTAMTSAERTPVADELRDAALDRTGDARRETVSSLRTTSCCRLF
jgi:hypothetical protein